MINLIGSPTISSTVPITYPAGIQTLMFVSGRGFVNSQIQTCIITKADGEMMNISATFVNSSCIRCIFPSIAQQNVNLAVANDGRNIGNTIQINVYAPFGIPTATSISPTVIATGTSTLVTVSGSAFVHTNRIACFFNGVRVVATYISTTSVICTTPALEPSMDALEVSVANDGASFGVATMIYSFGMRLA